MARKDIVRKEIAVAQSLAADFISPVTVISYLDNCSYQINITTSNSVGTFTVQGSNDYSTYLPSDQVTNAGNWVDLTLGGGTPFANAANDNIIIDLNQLPFNAIRIKYTSSVAGTGHCDIWVMGKQIGG